MPTSDTNLQQFLVWVGTEAQIQGAIQGGDIGSDDFCVTTDGPYYATEATITALSATDSITLADNTIYNGSTQTSLTIALWAAPTVASISQIVFSSGATETSVSFPGTINWLGDDLIYDAILQKFIFGPVANKRYTIMFYYDGVNTVGIVKGV